jgi:nucleoredoxin
MSFKASDLFGSELLTKEGLQPTEDVLRGKKLIGIYFSAHWCLPCRGFTRLLVEFFSDLKDYDDFALEIVFVSSDSDQGSFDEYWGSMNFAALPFDARTIKEQLAKKYGVRGIPTFIILDAVTGDIKDASARTTVTNVKINCASVLKSWL